jgi:hypothetical protein
MKDLSASVSRQALLKIPLGSSSGSLRRHCGNLSNAELGERDIEKPVLVVQLTVLLTLVISLRIACLKISRDEDMR